ncbi:hypothetical protein Tcan_00173, partial [Toxocara canis]
EETDDSNYASSELSDQRQLLKEGDAASHNAGSTSKEQFIRKQIRNHLGETYQRAQIDDYPAADCHFNHMNGSVCAQLSMDAILYVSQKRLIASSSLRSSLVKLKFSVEVCWSPSSNVEEVCGRLSFPSYSLSFER